MEPFAFLDTELQVDVGLVRSIITCTLKSQGQLSHSPDSGITSAFSGRLPPPSREKERATWISVAEKDDSDSASCPVLLGTTAVPGADCAFAGTPTFSLNSPVVSAPPKFLRDIPASLPALCLCGFPSQLCAQFRIKYSNFSKSCFYVQLIIHVFWTFFEDNFWL